MRYYLYLLTIIFLIYFSIIAFAVPVEITIEYGEEVCTENWDCTDWGACEAGTQTRTCTDLNNCGTTLDKPDESRSCTVTSPPPPGGPGGPGGPVISDGVTSSDTTTSPEPEPDIPPEPELKESPDVKLQVTAIDKIEAGEPLTVTVKIDSSIYLETDVELLKEKQPITLMAGESKTLSFYVYAPEKGGKYNLVAVTPYATGNKTVNLDYKPLFLYVNPLEGNTYEIRLKNFDDTSTTELQIVRDEMQTVYLDSLKGKTDYKVNLSFSKPGKYEVKAQALSGSDILDEDTRVFEIKGEPAINYGLLLLIVALIVILIGSILIFKELKR